MLAVEKAVNPIEDTNFESNAAERQNVAWEILIDNESRDAHLDSRNYLVFCVYMYIERNVRNEKDSKRLPN